MVAAAQGEFLNWTTEKSEKTGKNLKKVKVNFLLVKNAQVPSLNEMRSPAGLGGPLILTQLTKERKRPLHSLQLTDS